MRRRLQPFVTWSGPVVAAAIGLAWYLAAGRYVSSDNAYVKADVVLIAPRMDGTVAEVAVTSDAPVAAGDVILRLDDTEARIALAKAEAELAIELTELESLRLQAATARATVAARRASLAYQRGETARLEGLAERGIASRVSYDAARETARAANDALTVAERELQELEARLGGDPAPPAAAHPRIVLRQAAVDDARVRLGYSVIRSPREAQAGTVDVHVGEQVKAGERILSLVGTASPWIEANLKETQLRWLRVGQPAEVRIDSYPGVLWRARVASIGPATGAEFALLPPENASGNWVKIVQRLPVRLELEPDNPSLDLRAGMSAELVIDTGADNRRFRRLLRGVRPDGMTAR